MPTAGPNLLLPAETCAWLSIASFLLAPLALLAGHVRRGAPATALGVACMALGALAAGAAQPATSVVSATAASAAAILTPLLFLFAAFALFPWAYRRRVDAELSRAVFFALSVSYLGALLAIGNIALFEYQSRAGAAGPEARAARAEGPGR